MFSYCSIRFVQLLLLKSTDNADIEWCKEVKGNMYDMVIEGFQLLSKWTARIWEQCAWKFSRPYKDAVPSETNEASASYSDYEKVLYSIHPWYLLLGCCARMVKNNLWLLQSYVSLYRMCEVKIILGLVVLSWEVIFTSSDKRKVSMNWNKLKLCILMCLYLSSYSFYNIHGLQFVNFFWLTC